MILSHVGAGLANTTQTDTGRQAYEFDQYPNRRADWSKCDVPCLIVGNDSVVGGHITAMFSGPGMRFVQLRMTFRNE